MDNAAFTQAYTHARRAAEVHAARAINAGWVHRDDQEDVVQDALIGVWQKMCGFDSRRASMATFVEMVVSSNITSSIRKVRALKRQVEEISSETLDMRDFVQEILVRVDVERVLDQLHPFDRLVATLLVDNSPTEVAEMLDKARSTVYRSISRIRSAFAKAWDRAGLNVVDEELLG